VKRTIIREFPLDGGAPVEKVFEKTVFSEDELERIRQIAESMGIDTE